MDHDLQPRESEHCAELRFWHTYDTESGFDGGVVEVSTNGGSGWTDLDGSFTQNAYNGSISTSFSSPIAGQAAFTGDSSGYLETVADLSAFSGTSILVRFRMASDSSANGNGWWVDDVSIQSGGSWTAIGDSAPGGTSIAWTVPAGPGTDYCVAISAAAPGFTGSSTQGGVFSVTGGSDLIFADDFETGNTGMWSARYVDLSIQQLRAVIAIAGDGGVGSYLVLSRFQTADNWSAATISRQGRTDNQLRAL